MTRVLYDLTLAEDRRASPFCWRAKYALAHKGLEFEDRPVAFTEIPTLLGGGYKTLPILVDGERVLADSWAIADHLDAAYPDRPPLFASPAERALCRFAEAWIFADVGTPLFMILVKDIHDHALAQDRAYFRESREKRLGRTLEEAVSGREERVEALRTGLGALRLTLSYQQQRFLAGDAPGYADYIAAGVLLWAASVTTIPLLAADDPVVAWLERVRDLHGGLGRRHPLNDLVGSSAC